MRKVELKNNLPDWDGGHPGLECGMLYLPVFSNPPEFLWLPLSDLREKSGCRNIQKFSFREMHITTYSGNICRLTNCRRGRRTNGSGHPKINLPLFPTGTAGDASEPLSDSRKNERGGKRSRTPKHLKLFHGCPLSSLPLSSLSVSSICGMIMFGTVLHLPLP